MASNINNQGPRPPGSPAHATHAPPTAWRPTSSPQPPSVVGYVTYRNVGQQRGGIMAPSTSPGAGPVPVPGAVALNQGGMVGNYVVGYGPYVAAQHQQPHSPQQQQQLQTHAQTNSQSQISTPHQRQVHPPQQQHQSHQPPRHQQQLQQQRHSSQHSQLYVPTGGHPTFLTHGAQPQQSQTSLMKLPHQTQPQPQLQIKPRPPSQQPQQAPQQPNTKGSLLDNHHHQQQQQQKRLHAQQQQQQRKQLPQARRQQQRHHHHQKQQKQQQQQQNQQQQSQPKQSQQHQQQEQNQQQRQNQHQKLQQCQQQKHQSNQKQKQHQKLTALQQKQQTQQYVSRQEPADGLVSASSAASNASQQRIQQPRPLSTSTGAHGIELRPGVPIPLNTRVVDHPSYRAKWVKLQHVSAAECESSPLARECGCEAMRHHSPEGGAGWIAVIGKPGDDKTTIGVFASKEEAVKRCVCAAMVIKELEHADRNTELSGDPPSVGATEEMGTLNSSTLQKQQQQQQQQQEEQPMHSQKGEGSITTCTRPSSGSLVQPSRQPTLQQLVRQKSAEILKAASSSTKQKRDSPAMTSPGGDVTGVSGTLPQTALGLSSTLEQAHCMSPLQRQQVLAQLNLNLGTKGAQETSLSYHQQQHPQSRAQPLVAQVSNRTGQTSAKKAKAHTATTEVAALTTTDAGSSRQGEPPSSNESSPLSPSDSDLCGVRRLSSFRADVVEDPFKKNGSSVGAGSAKGFVTPNVAAAAAAVAASKGFLRPNVAGAVVAPAPAKSPSASSSAPSAGAEYRIAGCGAGSNPQSKHSTTSQSVAVAEAVEYARSAAAAEIEATAAAFRARARSTSLPPSSGSPGETRKKASGVDAALAPAAATVSTHASLPDVEDLGRGVAGEVGTSTYLTDGAVEVTTEIPAGDGTVSSVNASLRGPFFSVPIGSEVKAPSCGQQTTREVRGSSKHLGSVVAPSTEVEVRSALRKAPTSTGSVATGERKPDRPQTVPQSSDAQGSDLAAREIDTGGNPNGHQALLRDVKCNDAFDGRVDVDNGKGNGNGSRDGGTSVPLDGFADGSIKIVPKTEASLTGEKSDVKVKGHAMFCAMSEPNTGKLIQVFKSVSEAERQTGTNKVKIYNVCRRQGGGIVENAHWQYVDRPRKRKSKEKKQKVGTDCGECEDDGSSVASNGKKRETACVGLVEQRNVPEASALPGSPGKKARVEPLTGGNSTTKQKKKKKRKDVVSEEAEEAFDMRLLRPLPLKEEGPRKKKKIVELVDKKTGEVLVCFRGMEDASNALGVDKQMAAKACREYGKVDTSDYFPLFVLRYAPRKSAATAYEYGKHKEDYVETNESLAELKRRFKATFEEEKLDAVISAGCGEKDPNAPTDEGNGPGESLPLSLASTGAQQHMQHNAVASASGNVDVVPVVFGDAMEKSGDSMDVEVNATVTPQTGGESDRDVSNSQDHQFTCLICQEHRASVVFDPCRHCVVCPACAEDGRGCRVFCPSCRVPIMSRSQPSFAKLIRPRIYSAYSFM